MDRKLTSADMALLDLLVTSGPHRFPLKTDVSDDQATLHVESLVALGLIERARSTPGAGTTYTITEEGRAAFRRAKKQNPH